MSDAAPRRIAIVGAGLAGLRCAEALRAEGYDGAIALLGDEPEAPYDRPPLSKGVLTGTRDSAALGYRTPEELAALGVELRLGLRAERLRASELAIDTAAGAIRFDGLVIASGSRARRLPDLPPLEGVHTLRTIEDGRRLRAALADAASVVVVGAGLVGCEVASSARSLGLEVTVVEAARAPLERLLGAEVGRACGELHAERGTRLRCGVALAGIHGGGAVRSVRLTDGSELAADVVVVAVGAAPNTEWLDGSGLPVRDGVVCDATLAVGGTRVFAAGDVARWEDASGRSVRSEHWTNAVEQARCVARNMLLAPAERTPFAGSGFVWSEQCGCRLQLLGSTAGATERLTAWGALEDRAWVVLYGHAGRVTGAFGLNAAAQVMRCRPLIERRAAMAEALIELGSPERVALE